MDRVIGGKFKLGRKIGSGSFGEIYIGIWFIKSINLTLFFFFCILIYSESDTNFDFQGINVQTGEEVGIKLVCYGL